MTGLCTVRAEIGIGEDAGSTQARERSDCDRQFVGVEMLPGEQASCIRNEETGIKEENGALAYNAYWARRKVSLGWNLCMEIRELTLTCISHTRGER